MQYNARRQKQQRFFLDDILAHFTDIKLVQIEINLIICRQNDLNWYGRACVNVIYLYDVRYPQHLKCGKWAWCACRNCLFLARSSKNSAMTEI
jgi:hypothetical protein